MIDRTKSIELEVIDAKIYELMKRGLKRLTLKQKNELEKLKQDKQYLLSNE